MTADRLREIRKLVEACQHTDNSELDVEKTAVVEELLGEVERLESGNVGGLRAMAKVLAEIEEIRQGR